MKKILFLKAVAGTSLLAISSSLFATDVGIIPDTSCPANSELITIYMDDEDTNNNSNAKGWVGAIRSNGNTLFKFCRVNGDIFKPLSNKEDYAVLKLSDSCPNNSIEFSRYFDNEDNENRNYATGNIYPNSSNHNTNLKFCYFKGRNYGMSSFPDLGVAYGVFGPKHFSKSLENGKIYTDDEDNNNANSINTHGHKAIKKIIRANGNTKLNVHKVKAAINQGQHKYGKKGPFGIDAPIGSESGDYTLYYPSNMANMDSKPPLVFMVAGGDGMVAEDYQTLIKFIVSHGNAVLVSKGSYDPADNIDRLNAGIQDYNIQASVDTSRIGVVGHSTGGANAFNVLKHFSAKGYGSNAKFIYSFDPFHIRAMHENDLRTLPSDTKVIIFQSTKNGLAPGPNETPKIPLTIYSLLDSIHAAEKDYQVSEDKDGHEYITGGEYTKEDVANMEHVLEPLDALMAYTFKNIDSARRTALEVGTDHPISEKKVDLSGVFKDNSRCVHGNRDNYPISSCSPKRL